jgi:hypothetical protein
MNPKLKTRNPEDRDSYSKDKDEDEMIATTATTRGGGGLNLKNYTKQGRLIFRADQLKTTAHGAPTFNPWCQETLLPPVRCLIRMR